MGLGASRERRRLEAELAARDEQLAAMKARLDALDAAARAELDKDVFTETVLPFTSQALMGSTLGYASGYTLKLVGRVAAVGVGSGFIMLQGLSYLGYVDVDWRKVERDYTRRLDRDGDGEVSSSDLAAIGRDVGDVLAFNLPAGTGFTGGRETASRLFSTRRHLESPTQAPLRPQRHGPHARGRPRRRRRPRRARAPPARRARRRGGRGRDDDARGARDAEEAPRLRGRRRRRGPVSAR